MTLNCLNSQVGLEQNPACWDRFVFDHIIYLFDYYIIYLFDYYIIYLFDYYIIYLFDYYIIYLKYVAHHIIFSQELEQIFCHRLWVTEL